MNTLQSLIASNPVLSCLDPSDAEELVRLAISRFYQKGEKAILYGDIWPYLILVGEGSMDAVKESGEGRNLLVTMFSKGELFWGLAFFQENAPMPVTLEAHKASRLYLWSREDVAPLFERNGRAGWELCRLMAGRMQRASAILEEMAFQPVAGRLARLLLDHFEPAGDAAISRHLTLDEMAARIGSTREMVCRALYRFAEQGAIQINRTEFIFTDRRILEEQTRRG